MVSSLFFSFLGIYLVSGIFYLLCTFLPPLGTNGFDSMLKVSAAPFTPLLIQEKRREDGGLKLNPSLRPFPKNYSVHTCIFVSHLSFLSILQIFCTR